MKNCKIVIITIVLQINLLLFSNDLLYNKIFYDEIYINSDSNIITKKNKLENNTYIYEGGRLTEKKDTNGIITKYYYNINNQLKNKKNYNNGNIIESYYYFYNKKGQLTSIEHFDNFHKDKDIPIETTYFEYNKNGNLLSKIIYDLNGGFKFYYRYNNKNKLVQIKYSPFYLPESHILLYEYDNRGLVAKEYHLYFLNGNNIDIELDYDPETMIPTNIITTEYKYDKQKKLIKSIQSNNNVINETYYFYKN